MLADPSQWQSTLTSKCTCRRDELLNPVDSPVGRLRIAWIAPVAARGIIRSSVSPLGKRERAKARDEVHNSVLEFFGNGGNSIGYRKQEDNGLAIEVNVRSVVVPVTSFAKTLYGQDSAGSQEQCPQGHS